MKSLYLAPWKTFIRYHEISGDGKTLIYLPGLSFPSLVNFLSVATHPELRGYHAIFVDYLGSGFSDHPDDFSHSMEDHAQTVASILDHEGVNNCTVIGHSMGGTVGIVLALKRPDLVSNLIVSEANVTPGGGVTTRHIASFSKAEYVEKVFPASLEEWHQAAIEGDAKAKFLAGAWGTVDPVGLYENSVALVGLERSFKEQYLQLPIRCTFVYGERTLPESFGDIRADAPDPKELEEHGIQIGIVPNTGHGLMLDNLDGFVKVLRKSIT